MKNKQTKKKARKKERKKEKSNVFKEAEFERSNGSGSSTTEDRQADEMKSIRHESKRKTAKTHTRQVQKMQKGRREEDEDDGEEANNENDKRRGSSRREVTRSRPK